VPEQCPLESQDGSRVTCQVVLIRIMIRVLLLLQFPLANASTNRHPSVFP
jgi:hypothetical protein